MGSPTSLSEAFRSAGDRWAHRPALVRDGAVLSFADLIDRANSLARSYARLGIAAGDRIVCSTSNRPETVVALVGAWMRGAVHVAADYQFTARELLGVLERTDARALVYEPPYAARDPLSFVRAIRDARPDVRVIIVGEERAARCERLDELTSDGASPPAWARPEPDEPAVVFISSGTTGVPKATVGYHGNLASRWSRLGPWLGFGADDVHLGQLPLSHGFGITIAVSALLSGGKLALVSRPSTENSLRVITEQRVTVVGGAPTHFQLLLARLDPERHDVGSLRLGLGTAAGFPPPLVRAIWDTLQMDFVFMYGSSEGIGLATRDRDDILRGSVGRPRAGSVIVVDEHRRELPVGEVGELAFSRRVFPVTLWGEREDASEWFYSGDRGRIDEDGRLYVYGRLKLQIDRGGLKVDPVEVEAALLDSPRILDGVVLGMPDPVLGEVTCACIVPTGEEPQPRLGELRQRLGTTLAPYKLPDELRTLSEIPRTAVGKVDLPRLRDLLEHAPHVIERTRGA